MSAARRLFVATLFVLVGGLVFSGASALAAPPEAPSLVTVEGVNTSEATFHGVLNPGKEGVPGTFELGTYEFLYAKSSTTCEGEGRAPESPGISLGGGMEGVSQSVSGLQAGTEYAVCLLARNGIKGESVVGPAVHFTTAIPVEAPEKAAASEVTATTATLHGVLDPHSKRESEPGSWEFRYRQSATECQGEHEKATTPEASKGHEAEAVQTPVSELLPGTMYTFCLRASNQAGEAAVGPPETFTTSAAGPTVGEEWVTNVASSSATLQAQINPEGAETTYRFEYGTSAAYGTSIPVSGGVVAASASAVTVQAHPQGLLAGTTYHFHVVATSVEGTAPGADHVFTTQAAGGELTLLDGRQWELVSPPDKHGTGLEPMTEEGGVIQAAADGSAITYLANGPVTGEPEGNRSPETVQVFSQRGGRGWATQDISTPHNAAVGLQLGRGNEYRFFSPDLSLAVVEPRGQTPLSAEATEQTPYLRDDATGGYLPLVTAANVSPAGTKFGGEPGSVLGEAWFVDGTPDLSHVVLYSIGPLTEGAAGGELYEWAGGRLQDVSVLPGPGEKPAADPLLGDNHSGSHNNRDFGDDRNAISADGSRIVWEAEGESEAGESTRHLYLRDVVRGETVQLDAVQAGLGEGHREPVFQTASGDGSKIFFTDTQRLTAGSTGDDLYEFDVSPGAGKLAGTLTDLAAGVSGVVGASEDGSYVYFVVGANLYVHHDGTTTFIAAGAEGNWSYENLAALPARVSPNGRFLAFMSARSLTGYDNRDAISGEPDEEVYLYDAVSGRLVCASCNPTGARPLGVQDDPSGGFDTLMLIDRDRLHRGQWLAGSLPGWTNVTNFKALYQSRYLSDSGRLFFDSADALVAQDTNGVEDVYEYEPEGVGSCDGGGGCVGLISSGSASEESAFLDASESGGDVFFLTSGRLVGQDVDDAYDVYDAHVCSAGSPCPGGVAVPPACTTADSCKAAVSPQPGVFGAPASATYSGGGNVVPSVSQPAAKTKRPKAKRKRKQEKQRKKKRKKGATKSLFAGIEKGRGR